MSVITINALMLGRAIRQLKSFPIRIIISYHYISNITFASLTFLFAPGAMYALSLKFVKSGTTNSVQSDLTFVKRPVTK